MLGHKLGLNITIPMLEYIIIISVTNFMVNQGLAYELNPYSLYSNSIGVLFCILLILIWSLMFQHLAKDLKKPKIKYIPSLWLLPNLTADIVTVIMVYTALNPII